MNIRYRKLLAVTVCTLTLAMIAASDANAQKIAWQSDINHAAQTSQKTKKPMLIEVGASWCGYCKKMQRETFQNAHIAKHVNACFIPVSIDADAEKKLVQSMGVRAFPTTVIVSPEMRIVQVIEGFQSAAEFDGHLERLCKQH